MSKRIGIREATREAMRMAAAMVRDADFVQLFGDDFHDRALSQEDGEEILQRAQESVVARIERLAGDAAA